MMSDSFKIRDTKLVENVFMIADIDGQGALDIRELCASILLHLNTKTEYKLAMFFEIMKNKTVVELHEGGFILKNNLIKIFDDGLKYLKQQFYNAK